MLKVLIVVTSHDLLGNTGKLTGYYLSEVSHPYAELTKAGIEVEFASIKGGKAPVDEKSLDMSDPLNSKIWHSKEIRKKLENTLPLSEVKSEDFHGVLFAGGCLYHFKSVI